MKLFLCALVSALLLPTPAESQTVWKCQINGKTTFSDSPCPSNGQMLDQRDLNSNTIGAVRRGWSETPPDQTYQTNSEDRRYGGSGSACMSDQEIRNLETSANSITLSSDKRRFLQDEVRRARQCRKGQGNYDQNDLKQLKEAQRAQNNLTGTGAARIRAEGIHSAADPVEAERIAAQRRQEEYMREMRRQRAAADAAAAARAMANPIQCDARGCTSQSGYFARQGNTNNFTSPTGRLCQLFGSRMQCN